MNQCGKPHAVKPVPPKYSPPGLTICTVQSVCFSALGSGSGKEGRMMNNPGIIGKNIVAKNKRILFETRGEQDTAITLQMIPRRQTSLSTTTSIIGSPIE